MLPWGHLAVGYLAYTALTRLRSRRTPDGPPTLALAFGTQLPDLVDKPLNWWFGVFDGRGVGHSLVAVGAFCVLAFLVARRYDRSTLAGALSLGLVSHLFADAWRALLSGRFARATFLVWPLRPVPTYPQDSPTDHLDLWLAQLRLLPSSPLEFLTGGFGLQFVLLLVAVAVWATDGRPGLGTLWRLLTRRRLGAVRTADR